MTKKEKGKSGRPPLSPGMSKETERLIGYILSETSLTLSDAIDRVQEELRARGRLPLNRNTIRSSYYSHRKDWEDTQEPKRNLGRRKDGSSHSRRSRKPSPVRLWTTGKTKRLE
jgi:hypothetical protein